MPRASRIALLSLSFSLLVTATQAGPVGYYRQPALHGETVVFVAEGDLWKVPLAGGVATRLTSHTGPESEPAISPDGGTVAFLGRYEGPREVYTMPLDGGLPTRRTYGIGAYVVGWSGDDEVLITTDHFSTLPAWQLARLDVSENDAAGRLELVPLSQAADGSWGPDGTLYFTRLRFQGSHTKRYQGGTAQKLWRFASGAEEAEPLTADYPGTSKEPMWWDGRVYFASDRDGTMNLWSMAPDGSDLEQHTEHLGWDVKSPYLNDGRIVYQVGADLHVYDISGGTDRKIDITLDSDLDQTRENWVDKPTDYITAAHLSPDGDRVVLTARGRIYVVPTKQGRLVDATPADGVRHRRAQFMPDGESLVSLSDASGEVELWKIPANGVGDAEQLTNDGIMLRWRAIPSPDGKWIAHYDKAQRLYLFDVEAGTNREVDYNEVGGFYNLAWAPDSRWLAYVANADNMFSQIKVVDSQNGETRAVSTDRFDTYSPAWSTDGKWLYVFSDRNLRSAVGSPWGNYQPEPFFDKPTKAYAIALQEGERSPFAPADEVAAAEDVKEDGEDGDDNGDNGDDDSVTVAIDFDGIEARLYEIPIPVGNYFGLAATGDALFWLARGVGERELTLQAMKITNDDPEVETVASGIRGYELSTDGKKLLIQKSSSYYVVDAKPGAAKLDEAVDLSGWRLAVRPQEEWRQLFVEAWRLERDYFYDPGMHGVDWDAMLAQYLPLVDRVTDRDELSDLISQMVAELSALHTFVYGGDLRRGPDDIDVASLGARLARDEAAGGYRVEHVYRHDPDEPERAAPLAHPTVAVRDGDVIEMINGTATLDVPDIGELLRHQAGKQVLLRVKPAAGGASRDVIAEPFSARSAWDLRYHEWEFTRRQTVEEMGDGDIGYVHLRAMGGGNFTEWAKGYYPVFNRKGLIIDVRSNRGGNIDSWILSRLLRKVWFHWSQNVGQAPSWNMQYAFRGHMVVLMDERTASDGEAFAEGFRRLGLGKLIGTRTWGGEIWLTGSNFLADRGVATAAEFGVYGPEGEWLIEGWGVDPDIEVDNLPHATFNGQDAQLEAAIAHLQERLAAEPIPDYPVPEHPDKSLKHDG